MTTPDWTSEIMEAMAAAMIECSAADPIASSAIKLLAKEALIAALPMIGKIIVERCVPGGTHCDPQQIADDIRTLTEPKDNGDDNG